MTKTTLWDASDVCLVLIDYQDEMFSKVTSSSSEAVELNVSLITKAAKALNIPIILSTVGVDMGVNKPTRTSISNLIQQEAIDRTSMNAWEDNNFRKAVEATGKKRIIFCALWTEICLAFPVLDAMADGYEVCIPVDAVGGVSEVAHNTAIERMVQKGAIPNTSFALIAEFFRDWKNERANLIRPLIVQHYQDIKRVMPYHSQEQLHS